MKPPFLCCPREKKKKRKKEESLSFGHTDKVTSAVWTWAMMSTWWQKRGERGKKKRVNLAGERKRGKGVQRMSEKSLSLIIILTTIAFFLLLLLSFYFEHSLPSSYPFAFSSWMDIAYICLFFFFPTHMNVRRFLLFYNHRFLSVYHSLLFFFFLSDFICSYLLLFVCLFACFPLLFFFSVCYLSTVATHSWSFFFSLFSFFPA